MKSPSCLTSRPPCPRTNPGGFTLVEMLLVLVILSTLAAIVYPSMTDHGRRARVIAAHVQIKAFRTAIATFQIDNDRFPNARNGLMELIQRPNDARNWRGPYLEDGIPRDPWGHDYLYACPGKHNPDSYDLSSAGPDGTPGTDDDIRSWDVTK